MTARVRAAAAVMAFLVAAALPALADRESAKFFEDRGEKALRTKSWAEAEQNYRKALAEDGTYHPARFGLAEALLGAGQRDAAVTEFRRFVADARAATPLPEGWAPVVARAEKRLETLDAAGNELRALVDAHVATLLSFARKYAKGDADVATKALRRILSLRPGHAQATQLLESLGRSPKGEPVPLFDGASLRGWTDGNPPLWQVRDGAIEGTIRDAACVCRTEASFDGDFDVRCEMRIVQEFPGPTLFALCTAYDGKEGHYTWGLFRGQFLFQEDLNDADDREIARVSPSALKGPAPDTKSWMTFEVRFRGADVTVLVNDEEVAREPRAAGRTGGFVGLKVQNCKAQFRKIEVVPR